MTLDDLVMGEWFAYDRGFAMLLKTKTGKITTFSDAGAFLQVKKISRTTAVWFQASEARNVPWRKP